MSTMIDYLLNLPRKRKQAIILFSDIFIIIFCLFAAFSIRLEYFYYPSSGVVLMVILLSPLIALPIFFRFGLYHEVIRFVTFKAFWRITQAITLYSLVWSLLVFMAAIEGVPRSVTLINWILAMMSIAGSRLFIFWLFSSNNVDNTINGATRALIYGAGSAGRQLATALNGSIEYNIIGFIDDLKELNRQSINGLRVYSKEGISDLIIKYKITDVLLAIPSISRARRSDIITYLESYPLVVRSLPGVSELATGKVTVNDLMEIDLRDLLGRKQVEPNINLLKINISNKVVLVTGAGGSIGSELCRQILSLNPKIIILYEISEPSLYMIEQELSKIMPNAKVIPLLGSVLDKDRFEGICEFYSVNTVYHAAAYKHVPLVELNPSQGILNNAIGTMMVATAAISSNVETFVLVSTDKAVRPTNVMGASKRIAELVLQALDKKQDVTCFTMVRFGNVLNSSGSVIPLFKKQIKEGGPVTVTDLNIVRYFMTIPEAVELVIQAGAMAKGGEVFVLDMGKPIRINDLAVKMIQLSGLTVLDESNPKGDIEIKYTGLRPGEKLYEELLVDGIFTSTNNKLINRAEEDMINWDKLEPLLIEIERVSKKMILSKSDKKIYRLISDLVPQFNPGNIDINKTESK